MVITERRPTRESLNATMVGWRKGQDEWQGWYPNGQQLSNKTIATATSYPQPQMP